MRWGSPGLFGQREKGRKGRGKEWKVLERSGSAEKEQKKQAQKENGWNDRERQRKKEEIIFLKRRENI